MGTEVRTRQGRGGSKKQAKEDMFPREEIARSIKPGSSKRCMERVRQAEARWEKSEAPGQLGSHGTTTASQLTARSG